MPLTVEAIVDENGHIHALEPLPTGCSRRALLTILEEPPPEANETALLSQEALAQDWIRPEEDEAWSHLQPARSC